MKKTKALILICTCAILIGSIYFFENKDPKGIIISDNIVGLNDLQGSIDESYFLIYPSDHRVSQKETIVKEISLDGEIINVYYINDDNFRRARIHQKPTEPNLLYLSTFSAAVLEDRYFVYDVKDKEISEKKLSYFDYSVGISHIRHFGKNILFQTIVSHLTGDQVLNEETQEFKLSISDYNNEKSYETEWGYAPVGSPLLQVGNSIFYATARQHIGEGEWSNSYIAAIDQLTGEIEYMDFGSISETYNTIYSSDEFAYILGYNGKMLVIDENKNYEVFNPFSELEKEINYFYIQGSTLMLNERQALHQIQCRDKTYIMGILTFGEKPNYQELELDYIDSNVRYKILYQDIEASEIYVVEMNEKKPNLLIIDSLDFSLVRKIPIEYPHLLDMVIKSNME